MIHIVHLYDCSDPYPQKPIMTCEDWSLAQFAPLKIFLQTQEVDTLKPVVRDQEAEQAEHIERLLKD